MAKVLTTQSELDEIFRKMERDYGALTKRQQAYAIREIGRIRGELSDMLADFADDEGVIKRQRATRVLRELDEIEHSIQRHGTIALANIIEDTSEWTTAGVAGAVGITASTQRVVNEHVVKYVIRRFGEDGLVLSDRVWGLSGEIRDELSSVIRTSIIKGEGVSTMIPKLRKVYENETWKIRRLAQTEGSTAYRTATAYSAQQSGIVKWVRLNDRPGSHRNHHLHRCYELAHENRYGEGMGVFKPTDSEIYMPHPNCRAYITYVLDEKYL